ncbi:MAG: ATP-binding protein [Verrucomicrobiota bacterium]
MERLYDTLRELEHLTLQAFELTRYENGEIDDWLEKNEFDLDDDGYYHSHSLLQDFQDKRLSDRAISTHWHYNLRDNETARRHLYALRNFGDYLVRIREAHPGVAWIYYQDAANVSIQFPYIMMKEAVPPDFDWYTYHTYVSACPENNPGKVIRWTAPSVDYANEGLITSVSIPVYRGENFTGLWSIDVPLKFLHESLASETVVEGQKNLIIDQEGLLIQHESISNEINKEKGSLYRKRLTELPEPFSKITFDQLSSHSGQTFEFSYGDSEWLVVVEPVEKLKWFFLAAFPKRVLLETVKINLEQAFSKISQGETSYRLSENPVASYQQLAQSFNEMASQLERSNQEREQYEQALEAEKDRRSATLDGIHDGVIFVDKHYEIQYCNTSAELILKQFFEIENLGKNLDKVLEVHHADFRNTLNAKIGELNGKASSAEFQFSIEDGRDIDIKKTLHVIVVPIVAHQFAPEGYVISIKDISVESELLEERLRSSKLESIGVMAGGIAHDFNNILTAVIGNLSLLSLDLKLSDTQQLLFEEIERAGQRASALATQLLTFSKGGKPICEPTDVAALIDDSVTFALRGSNIDVDFDGLDKLSYSDIDKTQINQVFHNLIVNAKQAMPDGGKIRIWCYRDKLDVEKHTKLKILSEGIYNIIVIHDEGVGIPEKYVSRIFDPYFSTKKSGAGLGLATTYTIIRNHGGLITASSKPDRGAMFTIYLPALDENAQTPEDGDSSILSLGGIKRLLIIDDDKTVRTTVQRMAELLHIELDQAEGSDDGISQYRNSMLLGRKYDIVIIDLTMPDDMSGIEVFRRLKEMDAGIRAIVSSGYSQDPIMSEYKKYGFSAVLPKPYTIEELVKVLRKLTSE